MMKIYYRMLLEMGIPRFYAEYIRNKTTAIKQRYEGRVSSLSIDLNGVIHNATQQVFAYGGFNNEILRRENMNKDINIMYNDVGHKVTSEIMRLYVKYRPETLIIAVDGVAPLAKMDQQRTRRYIGSIEALQSNDPTMRFDSAAISPGTDFMINLDKYIRQWLIADRNKLCYRVIYSSHLLPGEGEHKIMDMMREHAIYYDIAHKTDEDIHLLHGADADLFMLSMLSPLNRIYIIREDNYGTNFIDIETLKANIKQQMGTDTAIQDFVIIGFLLGNDFVPHIFALSEVIETLDTAIAIYKQNGEPLVFNNRLNLEGLKLLMETLAFSEKSYLERLAGRIIKYPHPAFEASKTITQSGSSTKVNIVYSMFKDNWYNYNISPKYDSNIINYHAYDYTDIINDAAQSFTATLEWVWLYYSSGTKDINLDWYYAYSFAPLLTDMTSHNFFDGSFREHLVETDNAHAFYHPLQQMMMIFHPRSSNLIPFGLGSLMSSASNLVDMYPTTALITHDGYNTDWQKDILLPPLDPQRIVDAVKPQTLPNIHVRYPYDTQVFDDVADQLKKQRTNVARVTQRQTNTPVTTNPIPSNRGLTSALSGRQSSAMIQPFVRRR